VNGTSRSRLAPERRLDTFSRVATSSCTEAALFGDAPTYAPVVQRNGRGQINP